MSTSFDRWRHRLAGAKAEAAKLASVEPALASLPPDHADWSRSALRAFTIEGVYSGLEDLLRDVAVTIDGTLPRGADWHAALIEQLAAAVPGVRVALLSPTSHRLLDYLRRFRHVVRANYGLDLKADRVEDSLRVMRELLPVFEADLRAFEAAMTADPAAGAPGGVAP